MTTQYNSNYDGTVPFSDTMFQVSLVADTDIGVVVPGTPIDKYQAEFSFTEASNVFVCKGNVAVVPADGTATTQAYNVFRPKKKYVSGGDVLHFITPDSAAYFSVSLMKLQG